ncbi:N-acetylglutaminylglutamine synthetase [Hahella aquimaris]|uniref:N-acetylglutaminylglutamine synthetase n=1 Tax=Hahella sp. HNIBRBA332 TaxID=3015983 RepID=UPI00273AF115|nr:N-acetylglutaminylglutamine synthetase [Hahella sp. HNIBRBA332]WLQ11628.1 N-acetylglutaminylglutamine synthetase [Hahella sp. HNIBRBA332]
MAITPRHHHERMLRKQMPSYESMQAEHIRADADADAPRNVSVHCGWGRLLLANTFESPKELAKSLAEESTGDRDIALYVADPHVVLSHAPQSLFLDPSDTMRLWMSQYRPRTRALPGVTVRRASSTADVEALNAIFTQRKMVCAPVNHVLAHRHSKDVVYLVAEALGSGKIIGTVMGVNHIKAFGDPSKGSSLWCLAVSPDSKTPGVGEALVRYLAEYFQTRECQYMDLSVLHDNYEAKALYEKLGFQAIRTFALKKKNAINEKLFVGPEPSAKLNPYAKIIVNEAMRRGIEVVIDDEVNNLFTLSFGGRRIRCHESLTDMTTALSMSLCQNKMLTHRTCARAGLRTPIYQLYQSREQAEEFLADHGAVVVKPLDSEQGKGISVDIRNVDDLHAAISKAESVSSSVLLETYHPGFDLRVVVIDFDTVAAAIRRPAEIYGNGRDSIRTLVEKQSRRRAAATGGESQIPIDAETERCIREAGYDWDSVLPVEAHLFVRRTANLHTGGTLIDVTDDLHPELRAAAEEAARALQIPVVGMDFIVKDHTSPDYVIIEANERPGLENHAPQPTAQRFIDLLFPLTRSVRHAS